jgi:predicted TIM-barrel fold metal-dependent hydrolase
MIPSSEPPVIAESKFNRRTFLQSTGLATASVLSGCQTLIGKGDLGWVDAHVHVWTPARDRYPLASDFTVADMQPPSFTPEQLFAHSKPEGVKRVVLIQMSFYQFDNRFMLDSMRANPGVFAGVAVVDENAAGLRAHMKDLFSQGVRGFRIHPGKQSIAGWLGSPGMAELWKAGGDLGMAMCPLIGPEALPGIGQLCERFPRTRVVVDHFARIGVDGQIREEQLTALCRLAVFPNVHLKTSAFYALGRKQSPYTDLAGMIHRVRDAFGARRLMWGSDCPYQVDPGHTYADSIALIRDRLDFLTPEDRQWMLRKTAESVFFS